MHMLPAVHIRVMKTCMLLAVTRPAQHTLCSAYACAHAATRKGGVRAATPLQPYVIAG